MIAVVRVLALAAFQVGVSFAAAGHQPGHRSIDAVGVTLLVAGPLSLLALRRAPWLSLGIPLAAAVSWFSLDYPGGPIPASFAIALVVCSLHGLQLQARTAVGVAVVSVWSAYLLSGPSLGETLGATAWTLVVLTVAEQITARREKGLESRHARAEEERRRASDERLRIARELHDVLAHSVSLISVQAGVALHLLDGAPAQARSSLEIIRDVSRDTMVELRATVGALRAQGDDVPLRPTRGLDDLEALTASFAAAGVEVRTTVTGDRRPLPAGVDLAAYRIVQEALTNVSRHASTDNAEVLVDYGPEVLTVQVRDEGVAEGPVRLGNGLTGMRERATALGGQLTAEPRPTRGFRVEAALPLMPMAP